MKQNSITRHLSLRAKFKSSTLVEVVVINHLTGAVEAFQLTLGENLLDPKDEEEASPEAEQASEEVADNGD